jgi:hypothetical protein
MVFVTGGGFIFGKTTFLVFGLENLQEIRYKILGTFPRDAKGFEMVYFPIFASRPLSFKGTVHQMNLAEVISIKRLH